MESRPSLGMGRNLKADLDTRDVGSAGKEWSVCCTIFLLSCRFWLLEIVFGVIMAFLVRKSW